MTEILDCLYNSIKSIKNKLLHPFSTTVNRKRHFSARNVKTTLNVLVSPVLQQVSTIKSSFSPGRSSTGRPSKRRCLRFESTSPSAAGPGSFVQAPCLQSSSQSKVFKKSSVSKTYNANVYVMNQNYISAPTRRRDAAGPKVFVLPSFLLSEPKLDSNVGFACPFKTSSQSKFFQKSSVPSISSRPYSQRFCNTAGSYHNKHLANLQPYGLYTKQRSHKSVLTILQTKRYESTHRFAKPAVQFSRPQPFPTANQQLGQQCFNNQQLRVRNKALKESDAKKAFDEITMRQKGTAMKEEKYQQQVKNIIFNIKQQEALLELEHIRRQSFQRPFKYQPAKPPTTMSLEIPEQPSLNNRRYNINYYCDVDQDATDWEETDDSGALKERDNRVTVAKDGNCVYRGRHQVFTSAFAPLTAHALRRLRHTLSCHRYLGRELFRGRGMTIFTDDIYKLKPRCWLNDDIVNAYFQLLVYRSDCAVKLRNQQNTRGNTSDQSLCRVNNNEKGVILDRRSRSRDQFTVPQITSVNSFFYSELINSKNERVDNNLYERNRFFHQTKRDNVFAYDILLIPINMKIANWSLGVIDFRRKTVQHFDSGVKKGTNNVCENLLAWVRNEAYDNAVKGFELKTWKTIDANVPQHKDPNDCGIFTCKFGDWVSRGWKKFTFTNDHMNYFRSRTAHELMMGRVS